MKFKKGDIVVRNNNKPSASFESIKNCNKIEIRRVENIAHVWFYQVTKTDLLNDNSVMFPQIPFDEMYDLDVIFTRGLKINKLLKNINEKSISYKKRKFSSY